MAGRAIKRTMTVLHIDAVFFITLAVLFVGKSFLQNIGLGKVLIGALFYLFLFGIIELLAHGLKAERRLAWMGSALFLVLHALFAMLAANGNFLGFLGPLPYQDLIVKILAGYFLLSIFYGYMGLLSGQTLKIFFSSSSKIDKDTLR
jgi:hypothetical protein